MRFIIFCLLPYLVSAANILVLETTASPSHHIWIKTLLMALAERNHNITSISADFDVDQKPNLHYLHLDKVYEILYDDTSEDNTESLDFFAMGNMNPYFAYYNFAYYMAQSIIGCVKSKGYQQLLNYPDDFKFDLIIYDFVAGPTLLNFAEKFGNPPIIAATAFFSSSYASEITGGVLTPSFVPYPLVYMDLSSFWGRANNFMIFLVDYLVREYYIGYKINKHLKNDFSTGQDVRDIQKQVKLVFLNKHPALDMIEPLMPNTIQLGGLQIQRNKGLPKDLQEILDNAKDGTILFSLGTNVKSEMLGDARQTEILEAFRSLPQYTFIWKFEADSLPVEVPNNVFIRKFVPQSDLLAHPNLKLFISHCGLLSIQEAVWFGVPILGLPVFADQFYNLELCKRNGIAEKGNLGKINRSSFKQLIEKMLKDPKYRNNAKTRSNIFRDQKETPLERAVWWTEYVLRHPNMTFMSSPSLNLGIIQKHSWDILVFVIAIFIFNVFLIMKICCRIFRSYLRKKSQKSKTE